jgi:hypothetical protein
VLVTGDDDPYRYSSVLCNTGPLHMWTEDSYVQATHNRIIMTTAVTISPYEIVFDDEEESCLDLSSVDDPPLSNNVATSYRGSGGANNNNNADSRPSTQQRNQRKVKPRTAPQLVRTPIFSAEASRTESPATERDRRADSPLAILPQRPNATKPLTASKTNNPRRQHNSISGSSNNHSNSNNVSLENRILVKLATMLPVESTVRDPQSTPSSAAAGSSAVAANNAPQGLNRLPESRVNLMKLNSELDDMVREIRSLTIEFDQHNFGMSYDFLKAEELSSNNNALKMENGVILYDLIIADLTTQAAKKVSRIRRGYKSHLSALKTRHEETTNYLRLQLATVTGKYQELLVTHSTEIIREDTAGLSVDVAAGLSVDVEEVQSDNKGVTELEKILDETAAVPMTKKDHQEQLHAYISERLDHERKVLTGILSCFGCMHIIIHNETNCLDVIAGGIGQSARPF